MKRVEKPIKKFERLDLKKNIKTEESSLKPIKKIELPKKVTLPKK